MALIWNSFFALSPLTIASSDNSEDSTVSVSIVSPDRIRSANRNGDDFLL